MTVKGGLCFDDANGFVCGLVSVRFNLSLLILDACDGRVCIDVDDPNYDCKCLKKESKESIRMSLCFHGALRIPVPAKYQGDQVLKAPNFRKSQKSKVAFFSERIYFCFAIVTFQGCSARA